MKHAAGSKASISVEYEPQGLAIEVVNDAAPGPPDDGRKQQGGYGLGIAGMRERVALLGGTFAAGPRDDGGFRVAAVLPLGGEQ